MTRSVFMMIDADETKTGSIFMTTDTDQTTTGTIFMTIDAISNTTGSISLKTYTPQTATAPKVTLTTTC